MSYEGIKENIKLLKKGDAQGDAVVNAISQVEDYPYYKSVGFGGLPNADGDIELDAAFMNGQTLSVGAVAGVRKIKNPIKVAQKLSYEKFNNFLISTGAEKYAHAHKFKIQNMLSNRAKQIYDKKKQLLKINPHLSPYDGHDTVGMLSLDRNGNMFAGTSTSGLFYKKPGRIGDSPFPGCGYYCDNSTGAASATGLGEDIMKGCLSFKTVQLIASGLTPQNAAQKAIDDFSKAFLQKNKHRCGPISIIALDKNGNYGIGTNVEFSFVAVNQHHSCKIYLAKIIGSKVKISVASKA
jgi:isoaspartyl peptidase/L-asparaginase-like protein (Ntn-hydrolase superfamily)